MSVMDNNLSSLNSLGYEADPSSDSMSRANLGTGHDITSITNPEPDEEGKAKTFESDSSDVEKEEVDIESDSSNVEEEEEDVESDSEHDDDVR